MEVMMASPAGELNMDSACTSPYISAPSSPPRLLSGTLTPFFSAPNSPSRATSTTTAGGGGSQSPSSAVPFNWEEKPGIAKTPHHHHHSNIDDDETDFAFDFSGQLEKISSLSADELFDGGKIKPLKPPPHLHHENRASDHHHHHNSPKSPKKIFKEAFSPKYNNKNNKDFDPFEAALKNSCLENNNPKIQESNTNQRGRERRSTTHENNFSVSTSNNNKHKPTRSLSPFRVSDLLFDQEKPANKKPSSTFSPASWYRKWKLKDLLLFRSASEGRATSKATQYAMLKKTTQEDNQIDVKNASFRSTDSVGSASSRRMTSSSSSSTTTTTTSGPSISAHELHYTMNRAASEELKRKTFLPYKQGLLGCLGFNPAVNNEISRGIGSMSRA